VLSHGELAGIGCKPFGPTTVTAPALYESSVPVFLRYLGQIEHLLTVAEQFVAQGHMPELALLGTALASDMYPLATQAEIAINFSLRASFPLAGLPIPPYGDFDRSLQGLRQRLTRAQSLLHTLDPQSFAAAPSRTIQAEAGQATHAMPAAPYLLHYAMPNFFFHTSMVYAILRHVGVPVGKADFDGFHAY